MPAYVNTCLFISSLPGRCMALPGCMTHPDACALSGIARVANVSIARVECLQLIINKKIFFFLPKGVDFFVIM